ncbi:small ribosomal subunit protein bS16m-like [Babylonia areolata]|uniref:small ribosomal subunit protein bS16m-like n=1 Tax=Babylonia areolata TaxID=304850 RepID=UPI003FD3F000
MPRMAPKVSHRMIRFALHGCTNRPFYHIVVMPGRANRNAVPLEQLGTYDPMPNIYQEKLVAFNFERLRFWLANGAHCSKPVEKLLGLCGFFPVHPMSYVTAKRNRKKAAEKDAQEKTAAEEGAESSSV